MVNANALPHLPPSEAMRRVAERIVNDEFRHLTEGKKPRLVACLSQDLEAAKKLLNESP